jgi:hypothetical protein
MGLRVSSWSTRAKLGSVRTTALPTIFPESFWRWSANTCQKTLTIW